MEKIAFFIFGPQGSGKGTQAKFIAQKFNCRTIGSGDIFRNIALSSSEIGIKVRGFIKQGKLLPDDLVNDTILSSIPNYNNSLLFDGYPRTKHQAEFILQYLQSHHYTCVAILLRLDDKSCIDRILDRRICTVCHTTLYPKDISDNICPVCKGPLSKREDDTRENAISRLFLYHKETDPVIEFFRVHHNLIEIDGRPDIVTVRNNLFDAIKEYDDK
jgi:adenylate kinase